MATADNLKFKKGLSSNLDSKANENGTIWFTTDDGRLYIDNSGTRIAVNANNAISANKVNNNLIIQLDGGTSEGSDQFTFNGSTAKTINITPTSIGAALAGHTHNYLPLTGGTLTGNLTGKQITGTWLRTTEASTLNATASQVAVLSEGWIYYRTPAQILSDAGGTGAITASGTAPLSLSATKDGTKVAITGTIAAASAETNGYMSSVDKNKLDGIASGAEVNQNAFSNIKIGNTTIVADSKTDTLTLAAGSNITLTPDVTDDKVTIAAKDTTYSIASETTDGLMSHSDKVKLNGIEAGANNYTLPRANDTTLGGVLTGGDVTITNGEITVKDNSHNHSAENITSGTLSIERGGTGAATAANALSNLGGIGAVSASGTAPLALSAIKNGINVEIIGSINEATQDAAGYMSAADKKKLDDIEEGANNYTLPEAGSSLGGVRSGGVATISKGQITAVSAAAKFNSARTIELTGNIYGNTSSDGTDGWKIETMIADGAIITEKIADKAVTNAKLANSSLSIAGNTVSLGGSLAADTLRTSLGLSTAMHFIGVATVSISDGSMTDPKITGYTFANAQKGDVIIGSDSHSEFVWTGSAWELLGAEGSYKVTQSSVADPTASGSTIAFIDSIKQDSNGVIAPTKKNVRTMTAATSSAAGLSGLVPAPTAGAQVKFLRGDATWQSITYDSIGAASSGHKHLAYYTPAGSVISTFTGSSVASGGPSATTTVASSTHTHEYTPSGTVSKPTFAGSSVTSGAPEGTTTIYQITGVGTAPSLSGSVSNRCLTLTWSAGTVPTRASVTMPTNKHTHDVTAAGTVSQPTFTGTKGTTTSISGTVAVGSSGHTHAVTAKGSVSSSFSGTEATLETTEPQ